LLSILFLSINFKKSLIQVRQKNKKYFTNVIVKYFLSIMHDINFKVIFFLIFHFYSIFFVNCVLTFIDQSAFKRASTTTHFFFPVSNDVIFHFFMSQIAVRMMVEI